MQRSRRVAFSEDSVTPSSQQEMLVNFAGAFGDICEDHRRLARAFSILRRFFVLSHR